MISLRYLGINPDNFLGDIMFTSKELGVIFKALVALEKSVVRLANKEGQPENVVVAYREARNETTSVMQKVHGERVRLDSAAQVKK